MFKYLNSSLATPLDDADLDEIEHAALAHPGDSLMHQLAARLVNEVRTLQYKLDDPSYQYAGGRIHRYAIICRNAEIDALRKEIKELKNAPLPPVRIIAVGEVQNGK